MNMIRHASAALMALSLLPGCASGHGNEPLASRVSRLIDATTKSARAQDEALADLEMLGMPATPYLIGHLNDMRPLAKQELSLENKSKAGFEGMRHYSPDTVHDALSAVLNQITGESFVFVYNGGSPQQREDNRRKWIEWCQAKFPSQVAICGGESNALR